MRPEAMGFGGSGISWTMCKQSAPRARQITTTPHQSTFTGQMLFLTFNQQCQSTEAQGHGNILQNPSHALYFASQTKLKNYRARILTNSNWH